MNHQFVTAVVIGGKRGAIVEAFVPGTAAAASCYGVVPNAAKLLPAFLNPVALYDTAKLYVCGTSYSSGLFECYVLSDAGVWTAVDLSSCNIYSFPYTFQWFIYNNQIWIINDNGPKVLDVLNTINKCQNFWDTTANLPPMPSALQTNGAGCAVVVNDFVYLFANGIVRRFYLRGLGPGNAAFPQPDGTRIWENLGTMPFNSVYPADCAPLATNRNQILIEVAPTSSATPNSIIYDIPTNTFTTVASTTATVDFNGGTPLNELCHGDSTLYAFPYGTGAKKYVSTGATEAAIWPDVTSTGSLAAPRYNPVVVVVPATFLNTYAPFATCTGC
jgi:hypothetical protein